jgi:hypothetical protein
MREWHLVDAPAMTRQFYWTEIDIAGQTIPQRSIEMGIACRMRKPNDAQLYRSAFAPIWHPFVEHEDPAALNVD